MTGVGMSAVTRRRLHYFSGFDPRGPAHYHRLCREEAARPQPQGGVLQVGARDRLNPLDSRWRVTWRAQSNAEDAVETDHVFMGWDDQIRAHWARTPWALVRDFVAAYWHMFGGVGAGRARALSRNAFLTGVLPAVYVLLSVLAGLAVFSFLRWREARSELMSRVAAEHALQRLAARNRELAQTLIGLQEAERRRIAHELHDHFGQSCNAIRIDAVFLRTTLPDASSEQAAAARIAETADELYQTVRGLLYELRPAALDSLGLTAQDVQDGLVNAFAWAAPRMLMGAIVILPAWFVTYMLLPPRG